MKLSTFLAVLLIGFGIHPAVAGNSLRCGDALISEGAIKIQVLRNCGEPVSRERIRDGRDINSVYEGWVYEKGNYYYVLTFKGLRLVRIAPVNKNPL